ncbi:MAG TPA: hypothetical protein VKT78_03515 [Fimbriimonadaceae bacterium]|nr:hypothetical protein [Fimbriimonadaceae bacterium]
MCAGSVLAFAFLIGCGGSGGSSGGTSTCYSNPVCGISGSTTSGAGGSSAGFCPPFDPTTSDTGIIVFTDTGGGDGTGTDTGSDATTTGTDATTTGTDATTTGTDATTTGTDATTNGTDATTTGTDATTTGSDTTGSTGGSPKPKARPRRKPVNGSWIPRDKPIKR